jgi:hypothetical protein
MSGLSSKARALVDATQFVDEPSAADFDRVHAAIAARIAMGAAAGAVVLLSAEAASAIAAPVTNGVAGSAVSAASAASVAPSAQAIAAATSVVTGAAPAAGGGAAALGITSTATIAAKVAAWVVAVALTGGAVGITAKHVVGSGSSLPVEASLTNVARSPGAPVGLSTAPLRTGSGSVFERRPPTPLSGAWQPAASAYAPHPAREVRARAEAPTTAPDVTGARAEEPAPSNGAATLDAELALVRRARAALNDGRPEEALAALDEHASRFPSGVLAEDRSAQRVLALCALARPDAAREEGQRFFLDYPRSPHVAAIRSSCAFAAEQKK